MFISRRLVIIATQTVFSYNVSLIITPKFRKIESAPNDLEMTLNVTKVAKGALYVELLSVSPKLHSVFLYEGSFSRDFLFTRRLQW